VAVQLMLVGALGFGKGVGHGEVPSEGCRCAVRARKSEIEGRVCRRYGYWDEKGRWHEQVRRGGKDGQIGLSFPFLSLNMCIFHFESRMKMNVHAQDSKHGRRMQKVLTPLPIVQEHLVVF
jgi:hypothetical protein